MRRAARTDANQAAIVDALRSVGCSVVSLSAVGKGVPDFADFDDWRRADELLASGDASAPGDVERALRSGRWWRLHAKALEERMRELTRDCGQ